jgi:hypothetical protein
MSHSSLELIWTPLWRTIPRHKLGNETQEEFHLYFGHGGLLCEYLASAFNLF